MTDFFQEIGNVQGIETQSAAVELTAAASVSIGNKTVNTVP
jgi:hypothetical protein